jgi:hypothetical protein
MLIGILIVTLAGLAMGSMAWPMKFMRQFQFEHWWFIAMLFGLFILPWSVTLLACPDCFAAYREVDRSVLVFSNIFSLAWGIANVLLGLCFVRIGVALSFAILTGVGVSLGVTIPLIFKGSGQFQGAADMGSPAGLFTLLGVAIMLAGLVIAAVAGFAREKTQARSEHGGSFLSGLIMCIIGGILSCGISFAFVYSQGPIVHAMMQRGAKDIAANCSVWAVGLLAGGLVNVAYPAYLMTRNRSWNILFQSGREIGLAMLVGINFFVAVALMGKGMLLLGALGASVGFGIQQATQILGGQAVGFISGEWKNALAGPRRKMYAAIIVLVCAAAIMAYANTLAKN